MILVLEALFLVVALSLIVALFFRVRCPQDHALVLTLRSKSPLQSGSPSFQVIAGQGAFRTPSVAALDLLDLNPIRVDTFISSVNTTGYRQELHAIGRIRISDRTHRLRKAAERILGMPRRDLDAIGEGALQLAVREAVAGRWDRIEDELEAVEFEARESLSMVMEKMGVQVVELRIRLRTGDG